MQLMLPVGQASQYGNSVNSSGLQTVTFTAGYARAAYVGG
jgi:hypothetical protein